MYNKQPRNISQPDEWTEIRSMVRVANLFYQEGYSQREIADLTRFSSSKVSRLLKKARQQNIVQIEIKNPLPLNPEHERFLEQTFNLRESIVVSDFSGSEEKAIQLIGTAAANRLTQLLHNNMIIVIGQGTTMRALVDNLKKKSIPNYSVTIVPLVGGLAKASPETHTNFLARELADALGGTHLEMYAPQLADSIHNRDAFMSDSSIEFVLAKARTADILITGISDVGETSRLLELGYFTREDMERLEIGGAVGEIGSNFFNNNGQACCEEYNNRVVGLSLDEIKSIPTVIGLAGGERKVEAIHSILKGNILDILITDEVVAQMIHAIERGNDDEKNP